MGPSDSDVYVGNCCKGYQVAYYTEKSLSKVRLFYESELEEEFVSGGYPVPPNFRDFGQLPSSLWSFLCDPECGMLATTTQSVFLIDADELITKQGTVVIFQVHTER